MTLTYLPTWYDLIGWKLKSIVASVAKLRCEGKPGIWSLMINFVMILMNIFCNNFDAKASRIIANLIPRDLYQSSEAPAAGSEDKTNCAEEFSKKT